MNGSKYSVTIQNASRSIPRAQARSSRPTTPHCLPAGLGERKRTPVGHTAEQLSGPPVALAGQSAAGRRPASPRTSGGMPRLTTLRKPELTSLAESALPPLGQRERLHGPEASSQRSHKARGQGLPRPKGTVQKRYLSLPHTQPNTTTHTYHLRVLLAFHSAVPMTLVHLALNLGSGGRKEMRVKPGPSACFPPGCPPVRPPEGQELPGPQHG